MKRVSVALATFNGARYLAEQLQSLEEQTLKPWELVVSDDSSSDDTIDIVERFAQSCSFPVKIMKNQERLQFRHNFRRAAEACNGDLIAFCDQDDIWRPHKLATVIPLFEEEGVKLVYHNALVFDGLSTRVLLSAPLEESDIRQRPCPPFKTINGLLQVFRADLRRFDHLWNQSIDEHDGKNIMAHDQWYLFIALITGEVKFLDECLQDYRQHASNTIGTKTRRNLIDRLKERLVHFGEQDLWSARSAERKAAIIGELAQFGIVSEPDQLINRYVQLSSRLKLRAASYGDRSFQERAMAVIKLARLGAYSGSPWSFQPASMLRDVWSGVLRKKWSEKESS